ncbi:epithelial membrane protein 3-like isoform X2 [Pezoporus wallicus]|uniref:epithelial membrane protein 3-like isoform X2 n=1 Tax=Pezoporus wallicus TaxID=35540 RepID=UPI00254E39B5|nr:epithelial membrane protein 3-like isoform X2 [Pezoporus wallicus]XP_061299458.1 epithelial membrane protein 3-like isoform X2 [Pezoporus flaviventris]
MAQGHSQWDPWIHSRHELPPVRAHRAPRPRPPPALHRHPGQACLRATRGLLPTALLLSAASFGLFLWQLRGGPRGSFFTPAGGTQLLAALAALLGAGLYAARGGRPLAGGFGYCFALAWAAAALALGSGCAYLRLRKGA